MFSLKGLAFYEDASFGMRQASDGFICREKSPVVWLMGKSRSGGGIRGGGKKNLK